KKRTDAKRAICPPGGTSELEVDAAGQLEVAVAFGRTYRAKVSAAPCCLDSTKGVLVGHVQTIHFEDELHTLGRDIEASPNAGIQFVGARVPQLIRRRSRRVADLADSRLFWSCRAVGIWSGEGIAVNVIHRGRTQCFRRDSLTPAAIDASRAFEVGVQVRHALSLSRRVAARIGNRE